MSEINSFVETTNNLVKQVNVALSSMQAMSDTLTTANDAVTFTVEGNDPISGDVSTYSYSIPSYHYTLAQLTRMSNSVDTFVSGQGVVLLNDGTYREVKTTPVAKSPVKITSISSPTTFRTRPNWFFEDLMFPQVFVRFDLKGKIDDRSDRVMVRRLIFDNFDDVETQWFKDNLVGKQYLYSDVTNLLNVNSKNYWEDDELLNVPILTNTYTGSFVIINKQTINNSLWYYLDSIKYGLTSDSSVVKNIELKVGDQLRYNDSIFKINQIETTENRVNLTALVGLGSPTINQSFNFYSSPFGNKYIDIAVGFNECECIFLKGVNDDFNIVGDEWSDSISFYTNNLTLVNSNSSLETFYYNFVSDFGIQMEGSAKEKFIPAYYGLIPNSPIIYANQFSVIQINNHINAALDTDFIKNTQTQIESTKSIINSIKTTISQQKANLVELTDPAKRADLQSKIDNNTSQLSKQTVQYESLVKSLATLAYENNIVASTPKYRVRGFFNIPDGIKSTTNPAEPMQQIIQFEIAYRYLKLDNTGNPLNTFTFTDPSSGQNITGTFTDWAIMQSPIKKKAFDSSTGLYVWQDENIADGGSININQVDIPITKGEKVELKVRSLSEAGWPSNPLKSEWSASVVIEFPPNLTGSDQVTNILTDSISEQNAIKLDETLNSAGIYTHIQDGVPNPNSTNGTYFKHQTNFLAYNLGIKTIDGLTTSESTVDVQTLLSLLSQFTYVTLTKPTGSSSPHLTATGTLQQLFQGMVNATPDIYDEFVDLIPH
jgi:hypothetical protein